MNEVSIAITFQGIKSKTENPDEYLKIREPGRRDMENIITTIEFSI